MSVVDRNPAPSGWRCQDCGASIDVGGLKRPDGPPLLGLKDDGEVTAQIAVPGACSACGGGRIICDSGHRADAQLARRIARPGTEKN